MAVSNRGSGEENAFGKESPEALSTFRNEHNKTKSNTMLFDVIISFVSFILTLCINHARCVQLYSSSFDSFVIMI